MISGGDVDRGGGRGAARVTGGFMNSMPKVTRWIWTLVSLVTVAGIGACDKVPLLAPSRSTIVLTASSSIIPTGGSAQLTAFVTESSGTPVQNGTTVRFTTTLGSLSSSESQTNNGLATTMLVAGASAGVAEVRAVSGGATAGTGTGTTTPTPTNIVTITIGSAAVGVVSVRANPSTVPVSGGTVEIIAVATTSASATSPSRPLSEIPVSFATTAGTLSSTSATTDINGEARVRLTTTRAATVTAAVAGVVGTVNIAVAAAVSVTLTAAPATVIAGQAVTAAVAPSTVSGASAPRVVLDWGDGSQTDLGLVAAPRSASHAYSNPGTYVITAIATDAGETFTTTATVTVTPRLGPTLTSSVPTGTPTTNFVFTVTPTPNTGIRSVVLDFGDGSSPLDLGAITSATGVSHRFTLAQPTVGQAYTVRATQTDTGGNTTSAVVVITVTP